MPSPSSFVLSEPLPVLRPGDTGPAVVGLKRLLARCDRSFGVKGIPVGDTFDAHLEAIIRIFQYQVFLTQNGVVGPETWRALQANTPVHMPTLNSDTTCSMAVCRVQRRLKYYGLYFANLDGTFNEQTRCAIVDFQKRQDIVADGTVGPVTWHRLSHI